MDLDMHLRLAREAGLGSILGLRGHRHSAHTQDLLWRRARIRRAPSPYRRPPQPTPRCPVVAHPGAWAGAPATRCVHAPLAALSARLKPNRAVGPHRVAKAEAGVGEGQAFDEVRWVVCCDSRVRGACASAVRHISG